MNKKFSFSCLICIITLILSLTFYFNHQPIIDSENRIRTTFPELPQKFSTSKIHQFFTQLTNFYNDNFPNREKIILTFNSLLSSTKTNNIALVVTGEDDWLFLGNNYAHTIDKLTGKFYYHNTSNANQDLTKRYNYYREIFNKLSAHSAKIIFLIGPNKTSIYPEYLPKHIIPAPQPFHEQLTQKMKQEGINVYYPRQDLLEAKKNALLYFMTDSHWNYYGAFIAYIHLISQFDTAFDDIIKKEDFSFKAIKRYPGDIVKIGNLLFDNKDYQDNFRPFYKNHPVKTREHVFTGRKLNPPIKEYSDDNALTNKTLLVVGDSFANALAPYFSLTFKNWYFIHRNDFNKISPAQLTAVPADFILYETVERSF